MESDDVKFLRDQVERLNAVLAEYQNKCGTTVPVTQEYREGETSNLPWVADRKLLSPLLAEYDSITESLRSQLKSYHAEQRQLRSEVDKLVAENRRLTQRLKESVQSELEGANDVAGLGGVDMDGQSVIRNLQERLSMALQEKDNMADMYQSSALEIERLERQLEASKLNPRVQALERQAEQIKNQYVSTVTELNMQMNQLQEELKRSKGEANVSNIQVVELRRTLEDLRSELLIKEQQRIVKESNKSAVELRLKDLSQQVSDLQSQLDSKNSQLEAVKDEKNHAEKNLIELQRMKAEGENQGMAAMQQARQSYQLVEDAVLERDQAIVREKQSAEEASRLQGVISKLLDEAGARTRQEVDTVKKQCNQNLTKLMEELQRLELEGSEKQAELDRALREKRAAEGELERIYKEGIMQGSRESSEYNDLTSRACTAERLRDELQMKFDTVSNQLRRTEITHRQEKSLLDAELESLKDRYKLAMQELNSLNDDNVKNIERMDELRQQLQKTQQERDSNQRTSTKQLATLQHNMQVKEKEYEAKLETLEDSHRKSMLDMKEMLTVQQRMSSKWKEECNLITQKLESKVTELQNELRRERRRTEELTKLLRDSRDKTMETESKLSTYARNIHLLETRILDAERHTSTNNLQSQRQMKTTKGLSLVEARKMQKREFEQNLRDSMLTYSAVNDDKLNQDYRGTSLTDLTERQ